MRELGVQAGPTSVGNEVVVLVMVGGVGSTSTRGLRRTARRRGRVRRRRIPCQPSLGWPDVRLYASNCVLVTVVTHGAVGLEKSRAATGREQRRRAGRVAVAVGRMRALWICLVMSRT
jgi:hypothetical protein